MNVVKTIDKIRQWRAEMNGITVGLVPTMGYLHEGHLSLIKKARQQCDRVVVSIFVNPLQFGPQEDLETYPRDVERDAKMAEKAGVDLLFTPTVDEMYPRTPLTRVVVSRVTDGMCGASRPGHFDGVTTVVAKLFNIVQPQLAYFGEKDVQQLAVIQQMVNDLNLPIAIVSCPTVREADGLALSSRNVYLSSEERKQATVLYRALKQAKENVLRREWRTGEQVENGVIELISKQPLADIDYVEMRSFPNLTRVESLDRDSYVIAVAVRFGRTRLIDNILIKEKELSNHVPHDDEC